jgi:hypothetical protein
VTRSIAVGLNAVIIAVTEETPRVLTVSRHEELKKGSLALPFGPLDPVADRTLELGLRRWVSEQTGLALGYVEQLYTFADREREQRRPGAGARFVSIAYLALTRESRSARGQGGAWHDVYSFLPWEDWRHGEPPIMERVVPALNRWEADNPRTSAQRAERAELMFFLGGAGRDADRVLERYELLYEAGLVDEAVLDAAAGTGGRRRRRGWRPGGEGLGEPMAFDHRRMVATALGRLRGKIKYRPVVFELLPSTFTLLRLQRVVEALAGLRLHKQNFRRLVDRAGLVEGTGRFDERTGGRPAELFRFRREVLRERRAPGVGLPQARRSPAVRNAG